MATRFYLPSTGAAAVSPAYSARWEDTSIAAGLKCVTVKISSAMTTVSFVDVDATNKDILFRQYVSDPISAQTIAAQTVRYQIRGSEIGLGNNLLADIDIRVVSNDGTVVRGTILSTRAAGGEYNTTLENSFVTTTSSTEVIASEADRIVIEIGQGGDPDVGGTHSGSLSIGDDSGTDLPEDGTDTNPYNPWVNFANSITFTSSTTAKPKLMMTMGVG